MMTVMKNEIKNLQEVENNLRQAKLSDKESKIRDLKQYIGTSHDFIGLSVPAQRRVFLQGYSWKNLPLEDQTDIWDHIWKHTAVYEVMTQALFFFTKNRDLLSTNILWNRLHPWAERIDNWAHSDGLSEVYACLLEKDPDGIYPCLADWNRSENPWQRRQSLISLLEYSKKRKKVLPVDKLLPLVKNLLADKDLFVQKAVGWSLREIGNVYPGKTWEFLTAHHHQLSPAAFSAAIEKLSPEEKETLKTLRKKSRLTLRWG
jgi:3-methyladenine DNA glycosylase AlkD